MTAPYEVWAVVAGVPSLVFAHADRKRAVNALPQYAPACALVLGSTVLCYGPDASERQKAALAAAVAAAHPDVPRIVAPKPMGAPPTARFRIARPVDERDEADEDESVEAVAEPSPVDRHAPIARDRWDDARAAATPAPEAHVAPTPRPKAPRKPATPLPVIGGDLTRRALACVTRAGGIERLECIVAAIGGAR